MYAIVDNNNIFTGYTDNNLIPIPSGHSFVSVTQEALDQLLIDASSKEMVWEDDTWKVSDLLSYLKSEKIAEAKAYFKSIDRFEVNSNICRISKEALRDLWVDIQIQKSDVIENGVNACTQSFNIEGLLEGELNGILLVNAETIVYSVRCYKRQIDSVLKSHIEAIGNLLTSIDIANYNVQNLYPSIPEINY